MVTNWPYRSFQLRIIQTIRDKITKSLLQYSTANLIVHIIQNNVNSYRTKFK